MAAVTQNHHLIQVAVGTNDLLAALIENGQFDLQSYENLLNLPNDAGLGNAPRAYFNRIDSVNKSNSVKCLGRRVQSRDATLRNRITVPTFVILITFSGLIIPVKADSTNNNNPSNMAIQSPAASTNVNDSNGQPHVPRIVLKNTIDVGYVGWGSCVKVLAFSPSGRYLAILDNTDLTSGELVVWDMEKNRRQSQIKGFEIAGRVGSDSGNKILWAPDESYITLGQTFDYSENPEEVNSLTFWDPKTGKILRTQPNVMLGFHSRLSPDGSKLLTIRGDSDSGYLRVYDTRSWVYKDYPSNGIEVRDGPPCWIDNNSVLVVGEWDHHYKGDVQPGVKGSDVLARRIDLATGSEKTVILSSAIPPSTTDPKLKYGMPTLNPANQSENLLTHKAGYGLGDVVVLDTQSMEILFKYPPNDTEDGPFGNFEFSPDGKYLYMMEHTEGEAKSLILNASTGKVIGSFPGGRQGLSISPDGKFLATGNIRTVKIYSIK